MNKYSSKTKKNDDTKGRIIKRQADEIEYLKRTISSLEIDSKKKDDLIDSIDTLKEELSEIIEDLRSKGEMYDRLIKELKDMRTAFNQEVFKGRWKLIRLLMK